MVVSKKQRNHRGIVRLSWFELWHLSCAARLASHLPIVNDGNSESQQPRHITSQHGRDRNRMSMNLPILGNPTRERGMNGNCFLDTSRCSPRHSVFTLSANRSLYNTGWAVEIFFTPDPRMFHALDKS
jgi:hypothetical protein